jgi:hypothetical protein
MLLCRHTTFGDLDISDDQDLHLLVPITGRSISTWWGTLRLKPATDKDLAMANAPLDGCGASAAFEPSTELAKVQFRRLTATARGPVNTTRLTDASWPSFVATAATSPDPNRAWPTDGCVLCRSLDERTGSRQTAWSIFAVRSGGARRQFKQDAPASTHNGREGTIPGSEFGNSACHITLDCIPRCQRPVACRIHRGASEADGSGLRDGGMPFHRLAGRVAGWSHYSGLI